MNIRYAPTVVGTTGRIQIYSPFLAKDAIKESGVARWEMQRKAWTIPCTRLAIRRLCDSLLARHPGVQHHFDPALQGMVDQPTSIEECTLTPFAAAVKEQWPHQIIGSNMIGQLDGCMLAWDMGVGKTKGVFDSILQFNLRFTFVACPSSVVSVWKKQSFIHVPEAILHRFTVLDLADGSVSRRATQLRDAYERTKNEPDRFLLCAINYEAAWREDFAKVAATIPWDLVVADESHRIANHTTRSCKFMSNVVGPVAKHRVCLSGTPLSNGPIDAFGQFMFAEPALFGQSLTRFKWMYCIMGGFEGRQVVAYRDLEGFKKTLARITSVVRIEDVIQLPESTDEEIQVTMEPEGRRMYAELRENFISSHKDGVITAMNAISKLLRLQQMTSGYAMLTDDAEETKAVEIDKGKSNAMSDLISGMANDQPVVVFCRFVRDISEVHRVCGDLKRSSFEISGRANQQDAWEAECDLGRGPVIAVQIQAGGVGIDLTRARYCIYYSLGFSLTDYEQSRARVHRPGQKHPVIYYHLIVPGTVDRSVYKALKDKRKVVDAVIEDISSGGITED